MRIIENIKIDIDNEKNISFIRIDPEDISVTLREILESISNLSWISKFDKTYIRDSFNKRANDTAQYIAKKIQNNNNDQITADSGEYVVSELSRMALVKELSYLDIPLAEIFKEQVSGNPGFDFYSANKKDVIIFGEAKYSSSRNAYGIGMKQVSKFIKEEQDISDLNDIDKFFNDYSLGLANSGVKAYAIAFASKNSTTNHIIKGIKENKYYDYLSLNNEVVYLAVNL